MSVINAKIEYNDAKTYSLPYHKFTWHHNSPVFYLDLFISLDGKKYMCILHRDDVNGGAYGVHFIASRNPINTSNAMSQVVGQNGCLVHFPGGPSFRLSTWSFRYPQNADPNNQATWADTNVSPNGKLIIYGFCGVYLSGGRCYNFETDSPNGGIIMTIDYNIYITPPITDFSAKFIREEGSTVYVYSTEKTMKIKATWQGGDPADKANLIISKRNTYNLALSDSSSKKLTVENNKTYTVTNLTPGTKYYLYGNFKDGPIIKNGDWGYTRKAKLSTSRLSTCAFKFQLDHSIASGGINRSKNIPLHYKLYDGSNVISSGDNVERLTNIVIRNLTHNKQYKLSIWVRDEDAAQNINIKTKKLVLKYVSGTVNALTIDTIWKCTVDDITYTKDPITNTYITFSLDNCSNTILNTNNTQGTVSGSYPDLLSEDLSPYETYIIKCAITDGFNIVYATATLTSAMPNVKIYIDDGSWHRSIPMIYTEDGWKESIAYVNKEEGFVMTSYD